MRSMNPGPLCASRNRLSPCTMQIYAVHGLPGRIAEKEARQLRREQLCEGSYCVTYYTYGCRIRHRFLMSRYHVRMAMIARTRHKLYVYLEDRVLTIALFTPPSKAMYF